MNAMLSKSRGSAGECAHYAVLILSTASSKPQFAELLVSDQWRFKVRTSWHKSMVGLYDLKYNSLYDLNTTQSSFNILSSSSSLT